MYFPLPKPRVPKPAWFLGLDLAQRQDFTALAVLELKWTITGRDAATWEHLWTPSLIVRALDRYELAQSYSTYTEAVEDRVLGIRECDPTSKIHLALDAAGPGAPIVDDFRNSNIDASVHPITITGGAHPTHSTHGANVPRRALVTRTLLLMEQGTLQVQPGLENWTASATNSCASAPATATPKPTTISPSPSPSPSGRPQCTRPRCCQSETGNRNPSPPAPGGCCDPRASRVNL